MEPDTQRNGDKEATKQHGWKFRRDQNSLLWTSWIDNTTSTWLSFFDGSDRGHRGRSYWTIEKLSSLQNCKRNDNFLYVLALTAYSKQKDLLDYRRVFRRPEGYIFSLVYLNWLTSQKTWKQFYKAWGNRERSSRPSSNCLYLTLESGETSYRNVIHMTSVEKHEI